MFLPSTYIFLVLFFVFPSHSLPLSTSSRWIVDEKSGNRVKLTCVNWPGHLHVMIPEGLNKKPMNNIVSDISNTMGFNCVRLTWATYMYTRYSNLTVSESLDRWNLTVAKEGISKNNPQVLEMSVVEAQNAVVNELGKGNVMVVLDNHVSFPQWCCGDDDKNGFFGDEYFDPDEWVRGLVSVARRYKNNPSVIAMSMRNELRGKRQNVTTWFTYMQQGGVAIHAENHDVLVIFSGLTYDTNLEFLKSRPLSISLDDKLVFESHWYPFGQQPEKWIFQTNEYCASETKRFIDNSGFLFMRNKTPVPLFLSEFGIDQSGGNEMENRYFNCLLAALAENDIDWGLWQLPGSFMLREEHVDTEDVFGMYDAKWENLRNSTMLERLQFVQMKLQGPGESSNPTSYILYHPLSGQCVEASGTLSMTDCRQASHWDHEQDGGSIVLKNTTQCLTVVKEGLPPIISDHNNCSSPESSWNVVSVSKHHLASKDTQGNNLCLDVDPSTSRLVTNKCLCLLEDDLRDVSPCEENPQRQWLKLIPTNMVVEN